jgi:hydrogenase small subunit
MAPPKIELKITRRDFLKASALATALAALDWDRVVRAFADSVRKGDIGVVWLEAQDCAGNTTSIIQATDPSLLDVLLGRTPLVGPGTVRLLFHETVMPEWGATHVTSFSETEQLTPYTTEEFYTGTADEILYDVAQGAYGPYVLVLEGSLPAEYGITGTNITTEGGFYCKIGPYTCTEWFKKLLSQAVAVVGVGNCASYGGIPADKVLEPPPYFAYPSNGWSLSPTGAIGLFDDPYRGITGAIHQDYFMPEMQPFRNYFDKDITPDFSTSKPIVAVPGCPAGPNGIMRTLALVALVALGVLPANVLQRSKFLDEYGRPLFIFQYTTHEQCPRAAYYAAGDFRPYPGDNDNKCLFAVGCKGPVAHCPWNKIGWVAGVGGPTRQGGVCIACTDPGFTDAYEPFYVKLPYVGWSAKDLATAASVIGAATVVAGAIAGGWYAARQRSTKEEKK